MTYVTDEKYPQLSLAEITCNPYGDGTTVIQDPE